jgi:hypothetical protein
VADLHNGGTNAWYTDQFSGTSSASPIVVGACTAMQGWLRAAGKPLLTSVAARDHFRATGSPQQDEPGRPTTQRIGNRPNLRSLHARLFPKLVIKDLKDSTKEVIKEKEIKEAKELAKERIKDGIKDSKETIKELKEKDIKEVLEKDLDKVRDKPRDISLPKPETPGSVQSPGLGDRIEALETAVTGLLLTLQAGAPQPHFIDPELRPDVGGDLYREGYDVNGG